MMVTAKVICFASSKGGSGKTTITAAIGAFLQEIGERVLIIDCDEGTHGLTLMYLNEVNELRKSRGKDLVGVFDDFGGRSVSMVLDSLITVGNGVSFFPARYKFSDSSQELELGYFRLQVSTLLDYLTDDFDYILLDAQAGISEASKVAMSPEVSDMVVLVSEYDPMSNAGIERLKAKLPDELDVSRTWVLLNKLLPEFVSKFSEFLAVARFLPPIPWTADVVRAYSRRRLALDFSTGNQFTLAILSIVRELLTDAERKNLETWVGKQEARLKVPIVMQIKEEKLHLHALRELNQKSAKKSSWKRYYDFLVNISWGLLMSSALTLLVAFILNEPMKGGVFVALSIFEVKVIIAIGAISMGVIAGKYIFPQIGVNENFSSELVDNEARKEEVYVVLKRIRELEELSSANYEEIVKNRN